MAASRRTRTRNLKASAPRGKPKAQSDLQALNISQLRERQLVALFRLGKLAVQQGEADSLMEAISAHLVEALEADIAEIWIYRGHPHELQRCYSRGWAEPNFELAWSAVGPESHAGFTMQCGTVVSIDNLAQETRFFGLHRLREAGMACGLSAPIHSEGEPLGAVCVYRRHPRFEESESQFVAAAAVVLATSAQRHRSQVDLRENQRQLLAGIVRDMVERREVETALRRSEERYRSLQLQHTELERIAVAGELAGIVAHEVRTPLNALSINVQMLERALRRGQNEDLERARRLVGTLRGEIKRINDLLKDYLQILRRSPKHSAQPFSLSSALEDAIRFVEPKAKTCQVTFELAFSSAVPITLYGDEDQLRQVLLNVLLNAIQAMPDGGLVKVCMKPDDEMVTLTICDTGHGILPEDLDRIFRPFVTTKPYGTGLGLAISERLIRGMGGSIAVQSKFGEGSCFEIRLPLLRDRDDRSG